jgi:hypothetical protein
MPRKLTDIAVPDVLEVYPLMFVGLVGSNLVSNLADVNLSRALTVWLFALVASGMYRFVVTDRNQADRCRTWVLCRSTQIECLDDA